VSRLVAQRTRLFEGGCHATHHGQDLAAVDLSIREDAMRTESRQIWSLMARRWSSHDCHEPNGRRDTVVWANDLPSRFAQARSCRATTEGAMVELPLEHVGPEPKDSAQLCVAENERDRQESTTSARWNNYQQSRLILAPSGLGFPRLGLCTTDCRRDLGAKNWRDPLNDGGIHRSTPNRRDRTGEGGRFQQVNLGNRRRVKSVEIRVILPAERVDAAGRLCLTSSSA